MAPHSISAIFPGVRILHLKFTFACSKWQGGEYVPRDYNSLSAKWYCMDHRSKTPLNSYESTLVKIKIIRIDDTIASIRTECLFRIIPIEVSICIFIQLTRLKRWKWRMACCAFPFIFSDLLSDNVSQELKFFETLPLENERTVSQRIISKLVFWWFYLWNQNRACSRAPSWGLDWLQFGCAGYFWY